MKQIGHLFWWSILIVFVVIAIIVDEVGCFFLKFKKS